MYENKFKILPKKNSALDRMNKPIPKFIPFCTANAWSPK